MHIGKNVIFGEIQECVWPIDGQKKFYRATSNARVKVE